MTWSALRGKVRGKVIHAVIAMSGYQVWIQLFTNIDAISAYFDNLIACVYYQYMSYIKATS